MEGFDPVLRRKRRLEKETANGVIRGTNRTFRFPVLRRSIGT